MNRSARIITESKKNKFKPDRKSCPISFRRRIGGAASLYQAADPLKPVIRKRKRDIKLKKRERDA